MNIPLFLYRAFVYAVLAALLGCTAVPDTQAEVDANEAYIPKVSINEMMLTMIDYSAHYVWDYSYVESDQKLSEDEWKIVEHYAIHLAASGPLLTLGGAGPNDNAWALDPGWRAFSVALSDVSNAVLDAVEVRDQTALVEAGQALVDVCEGCHQAFKPELPAEGKYHYPLNDHLYHMVSPPK